MRCGRKGLRLIDADNLTKETEKSMHDNPHKNRQISQNHLTEHIHFLSLIGRQSTVTDDRITKALEFVWNYGQIDGDHHKTWVIDQIVRILCGSNEEYKKWVDKYEEPLEDGDYYSWSQGINP